LADLIKPSRHSDWHPRLISYLGGIAGAVLEPGEHDCALAFAGAVEAMTGVDLGARYRGRYTTFKGGLKLLAKDGWKNPAEFVAAHCPEVHPAMAHAGDIALVATDEGDAFGMFQGEAIYVLRPGTLGLRPRSDAKRAFHVLFDGEAV
jgi:hypothetical protein